MASFRKINEKQNCVVCKGTGKLPLPYLKRKNAHINNIIMAKLLHKAGYSLRQIGKFLGYKSPRSIQLLVAHK